MDKVRTRIAPSPTGPLHIGTARTALFNYLFARKMNGTFIMRLEDTDTRRNKPEYEQGLYDGLKWLGLGWDEGPDVGGEYGPYRQSERTSIYAQHLQVLEEKGAVYPCFCTPEELDIERREQQKAKLTPKYSRKCASLSKEESQKLIDEGKRHTVRFRVPDKVIKFHDLVRGDVEFDCATIGDFVVVKPNGGYIFHLTNIVDDVTMGITHVVRGEDHLSNTPKHIALGEAMGYGPLQYAHIPLILNPDRSKMSKRKSQTSIATFMEQGYIPEAMVNFLAFLGWSPGEDEDVFSLEELCQRFTLEAVNKSSSIFDQDKLDWLNGCYLRQMPLDELEAKLLLHMPEGIDLDYFKRIVPLIRERLKVYDEIEEKTSFFFSDNLEYDTELIVAKKQTADESKNALQLLKEKLSSLEEFSVDGIECELRPLAEELGWKVGPLFMIVRVAVTGSKATPPLFETMKVLGKERCVKRLDQAIEKLSGFQE
jgi:nondiscriminating glutamyl-tRNA synthetase